MCWQCRPGSVLGCHLFMTDKINLTVLRLAKKQTTASVCLSVLRFSILSMSLPLFPSPTCAQDPRAIISADSSNSCGCTSANRAASVTSCSCWGPFVLGGIPCPCRLKLIPSFFLNQTVVVCGVQRQQEQPERFLLGLGAGREGRVTSFEGYPYFSLQGELKFWVV